MAKSKYYNGLLASLYLCDGERKILASTYMPACAGEEELLGLLLVAASNFALNRCGPAIVAGALPPAAGE